ncbi:MAG TPA: glycosyltransferase family 1 protein [Mucilaginibacter sp.]|jgi:glycosyltransferase involved in cell wall biosynthesis|nr:glycosyltransferase family 1 protein [Mucilaginibacter sp.]
MKIGIWIDEPMDKTSGGSYTYSTTLIKGIDDFNFTSEIVFISLNKLSGFNRPCIDIKPHQKGVSTFKKVLRRLLKLISRDFFSNNINAIDQKEKRIRDSFASAYLKQEGIKIIFYPIPMSHVINGIPFILNNWDLGHYSTYSFPEMADNAGFHKRNEWYVSTVPYALMILSETNAGKKELINYLNLNPEKIKVLPMFSSDNLAKTELTDKGQNEILRTWGLEEQRFFFYPAQFWAHKNHYNLIKAFQNFTKLHTDFKLVLCGSDKGNVTYLKHYVKTLSLEKNVIFTGFIEDQVLYTFYKNARALIMPTFLGPSNIPPIEAMRLNCPVLISDLEGHREMLGDSALYFDPANHLSIMESMTTIMDDRIRLDLVQKQKHQLNTTDHSIDQALRKLDKYFVEAVNIRNCWE